MLMSENIDPIKYWIIPANDIMDNPLWVHHIKRLTPKFDTFYSNNQFTKLLFHEAGLEVIQTGLVNRNEFEGKKIRSNLMNDVDLTNAINPNVLELLSTWKINERLNACRNENPISDLV